MRPIIYSISILMFCIAAVSSAPAGTTNYVFSVAQLTNAVANASAGDTIVISTSLTPSASEFMDQSGMSFLKVTAANLTIMGSDESSRKTWTQNSEPVVINCGGLGRFLQNNGSNLTVKNITVTGSTSTEHGAIAKGNSTTFTNCVFRQNLSAYYSFWTSDKFHLDDCAYISNEAKLCGYLSGCDIANNASAAAFIHKMEDCTFSGHDLGGSTMITLGNATMVSNCTFTANKGTAAIFYFSKEAQIMDCNFVHNTNNLIRAQLTEASDPVEMSGCTFTSNVIAVSTNDKKGSTNIGCLIWNKTNNFTSASAAQSRFLIKGTTFEGNCYQAGNGMAEVFGVTATGCTFRAFSPSSSNPNWNTFAMNACNSRIECCDISGGELVDCVVDRCMVDGVGNLAHACFRDYCRVTNTLVLNCNVLLYEANYISTGGRHDAEFVNCTFAGNNARTYRSLYNGDSTNDVKFVNCLFNSNTNGNSVATDFSMQDEAGTLNCWISNVSFDHCFYGNFQPGNKLSQVAFDAKTGENLLEQCANPKFVQDSRPEAPYWSLLLNSPLIGKGAPLDFTASDLDLAGKLRLKDGKVDIGCYQCWLNPAGLILIFR